eukprot:813597-Alexandrium_andersonii.AAC.1
MPKVDELLPRDQGLNWREYVRHGRDDLTTYFDTLWQDGWINVQECPEQPPDDLREHPTHIWGSQHPRYDQLRHDIL